MSRPATLNADGAWGSLSTPLAVRHVGSEDQTYVGHVNASGDAMVTAFDEAGAAVSSFVLNAALDVDTHLTPVFRVRSDGKIQAFYTAHNDGVIRHRLSTNAEDISAWAAESTILSGSYTYPNVWDLTGKVVLHARSGTSSDGSLIFTESTDDGASWSSAKVLYYAGAVGAYFKTAKHPTDDRIDYLVTDGNPNNDSTSVYHFYREGDSFYKSDGTLIGTTGDLDGTTGSAFGPSDLTKVWDRAVEGVNGHVIDVAHDGSGNPVGIIAAIPGSTGHEMHHAAWNGSSWSVNKIADVGDSVQDAGSGGSALDPEDASRVWLSIEDAGIAQIWRYDTADGGSTWAGTQITHDYTVNMRPNVPLNRSSGLRVIWERGVYTSSSDFATALVGYGDDPSVGDGTLSRTTDGEVFTALANSEDDPFVIGDWEAQASVDTLAVQADNGSLRHKGSGTGTWHYVRCSAGASRSTRMVQAVQAMVGGSGQVWIRQGGHMETGSGGDQMAGMQYSIDRSPTDRTGLFEAQGTSFLGGSTTDASAKDQNRHYRVSVGLDGFDLIGDDFDDGSSKSHTGSNFSSGWSGIGGNDLDPLELYEFFDCTHWELTATGLSTGDKLQLRNALGVVLAEATESGGTATIDMTDVVIPEVNDLVVVDSGDALLGGLTLAGSGGPMGYARGGDEYAFTAAPATVGPDQPTITATVEGAHAISVESSSYSHPEGTDLAGFGWQIATDAGFTTDLQTVTETFADPSDAVDPPGYIWSGLDAATEYFVRVRHQDADGDWSAWSAADSATTDAEVQPATPSIETASVEATSVVLGSSEYDDNGQGRTHVQSHWQIDESGGDWSTPVNESEEDPDNLTSISVAGLTAATAYQARVRYRASDGTWSAWSAAKTFTTLSVPADRPAQPTLTVEETTQSTARISTSAYSDPDSEAHQATEWLVSDFPGSGTFGLAYRVAHFTSSSDLEETTFEGLQQGKEYHVTARHKAADGDWSDWAAFVAFTTVAHPLAGELLHVTGPWHGQVISGTVDVEWRPASETDAVFDIELSEDAGVSFSEVVSGHASSPYSWDVSGLTDGYKLMRTRARSTATGETTDWANKWVYVDNAGALAEGIELFAFDSSEQDPDEPITDKWTPLEDLQGGATIWSYGTSGQLYNTSDGETEFMRIGFDPAFEPKQVDIVADVMLGSLGGSFPWQWFPEQLWAGVGVTMSDVSGVKRGAQAAVYSIPINAHGDCLTRASGPMNFEALSNFDDTFFELSEALLDIGRLHFYLTVDGCNKQPRYGMRMRFTTIQELGGGRRRMRMQVGIAGRGIEPDPERGWQVERTFETDLTCGQAGCVVKAITTSNGPFVAIGHFTAHALEYGECDSPEGFTDPDPETCPPPIFDLTIFGDDDETPIWGSVDSAGDVLDPSFSTFPGHDRPYLKVWDAGSEHEADPIEGSSSIGAVRVEVLDKRTDPCDPKSGLLTAAMADEDGFNALIGRRAIMRERLGDGTYQIVQHGVVGPVELLDSLVTHQLDIRSMREREREVRLFPHQARTHSALPYGPVESYGCVTTFGETEVCLFEAADVGVGSYIRKETESDGLIVGYISNQSGGFFVSDAHVLIGTPQSKVDDDGNVFERRVYTDVIVRWRPAGGDDSDWIELEDMSAAEQSPFGVFGDIFHVNTDNLFILGTAVQIQLNSTDPADLPTPGQSIEWQVLANSEPSEAFPLWYEGFAGDLLTAIYDGDFSDADPHIRYATGQIPQGPFLRMRITKSADDLKKWVEEHIYQPAQWVPSLTEDGTIIPVSTRLPDASVSLTTVTNAEVVGVPLWRQDGGSAVPIATVRIFRESRIPDADEDGFFDRIRDIFNADPVTPYVSAEVDVTRLARSSALLRTKGRKEEPATLRVVDSGFNGEDIFNIQLETAFRVALDRVLTLTTRYAYGPELVTLRARDLAAVRAIRVGTWFLLETDHLPDLQNRTRGGTLLCLALRRQKDPGLAWDITALVGGPGASCASGTPSQPTLTVNDDLSITVTIPGESFGWSSGFSSGFGSGSGTSGTEIRVEYAISGTEPAADSGLWTLLGTRTGAGDLRTEPFPAGVTVWFRVQAQQGLCRPSAWTTPQSVAVGETTPQLLKLWITIGLDGTPVVHWWENPPTLGLRIEYGVVDSDRDGLYETTIEVDAKQPSASGWSSGFSLGFTGVSADRSYILSGVTVEPGHKIVVRATPFSGWDGANVTGTAGEPKQTFKHQTDALSPAGFSAGFSPGFGA